MFLSKIKQPFSLVLFGATGDLARVKVLPALYELVLQKRFHSDYVVLGYGRTPLDDQAFRDHVSKSIREKYGKETDPKTLEALLGHCFFASGQYGDPADLGAAARRLLALHHGKKTETLAHLGVPPTVFKPIIEGLAGLRPVLGKRIKVILEKPFGESEASATDLYHFIHRFFEPKDVFLLDHYLGKSAVQSILPLRYNNIVLNTLLKGSRIANIQINALESVGIEKRAGYFDTVGILKDMVQSHLMQVLALFTLSLPVHPDVASVRREKAHLFSALQFIPRENEARGMVLGQYKTYKKEKGIAKGSQTPTFAALRFFIDLLDWYRVPVYLKTGKKLDHKHTFVVVEFKKTPFQQSRKSSDSNKLIIELFPKERIQIRLVNEEGRGIGQFREIVSAESLACTGDDCLPEHARLILDAFLDRQQHFVSFEEIIACWRFVDRLWNEKNRLPVFEYPDGSAGPSQQHSLLKQDGFQWHDPEHA